MDDDVTLVLELAALLVVAVAALAWVAYACDGATAVRVVDVERALGPGTLMTYEQAVKLKKPPPPPPEEQQCALCLSEYGNADELVLVLPACGHFFHPRCEVEKWLQKSGTCPVCRGELSSPPPPPPPPAECPPAAAARSPLR